MAAEKKAAHAIPKTVSFSIRVDRDTWNLSREGSRVRLERLKGGAVLVSVSFEASDLFEAVEALRG